MRNISEFDSLSRFAVGWSSPFADAVLISDETLTSEMGRPH
jgi:hypothetical protein